MTDPQQNATPWMDIAKAEIGVKETPGPAATPRILEYASHTTLHAEDDETPWCASFANWVLDKAGCKTLHKANARSFLELPGRCEPRYGCIVVLWRGSRIGVQGHVGFLHSFTDDTVTLLAGNQGDAVSLATFPNTRVLGFRWPEMISGN